MSEIIHLCIEMVVKPGKLDATKELLSTAAAKTEANDAGVTNYQFFADAEGTRVYAVEVYRNAEAMLGHMVTVGDELAGLFAVVDVERMLVMGDPPEQARAALAPMNPVYMQHLTGFTR